MADPIPPPPGFTLDKPAGATPPPPAGFKVDAKASPPPPPAGFKVDAPEDFVATFLPIGKDKEGHIHAAVPGFVTDMIDLMTKGGKAMRGEYEPTPQEMVSMAMLGLGGSVARLPGGRVAAAAGKAVEEVPKPVEGMPPPGEAPAVKAAAQKGAENVIERVDESVKMPKVTGEVVLPREVTLPARTVADDFRRIFTPAKRGPEAAETAGIVREGLAVREQNFQQTAENLRSFGRAVGSLPPEQKLAFMDAIETGNIPKEGPLAPLATEIRKLFDERWQQMNARGIAPNYVQDYLPHVWKDPAAAANTFAQAYGKRSLEGGKRFTKERTFATIKEGMDAGLVPVTDNPIELSLMQLHQMDKFITAQDMVREMEGEGLARRVPHDERPPDGWIPIDDKIARKGNATLYAPEPAATIVNRTFSPGLSGQPIYDTIRTAGNMMNSAQLGLSGFHALFVTADAATSAVAKGIKQMSRLRPGEVARGVGSIAKAPAAPVMNYLRGRKVLMQYLGRGQYGPEMEKIVDSLIAGGGRARMDSFYRGSPAGSFWQAMRSSTMRLATGKMGSAEQGGRMGLYQDVREMLRNNQPTMLGGVPVVPATVKVAAKLVPRVMDTIMAPLMEDFVPKMKLGVFFDLMKDELRVNPNMTRAQQRAVAGRIWDSVDNRLGQLAYDNLFWNKTMKDVGHIAVRSLGWNLGTLRELGGGALDLAKGRSIDTAAGKQFTDRAAYVVAMPLATAMMGATYMYLKTGKGPQQTKDYFFPLTGGKDAQGGPERANMPGYFKDAYEWSTQPEQTATNKIHPLWSSIYQMMNNEQWNGAAIADTRSGVGLPQVKDYGAYLMQQFTPLSLRPRAFKQEGTAISPTEQFMGIKQAPYAVREPEKEESYQKRVISQKVKKGQKSGTEYHQ